MSVPVSGSSFQHNLCLILIHFSVCVRRTPCCPRPPVSIIFPLCCNISFHYTIYLKCHWSSVVSFISLSSLTGVFCHIRNISHNNERVLLGVILSNRKSAVYPPNLFLHALTALRSGGNSGVLMKPMAMPALA